jgi:hypothetical protein
MAVYVLIDRVVGRTLSAVAAAEIHLTRVMARTLSVAPADSGDVVPPVLTNVTYQSTVRPIRRVRQMPHFTAEQAWIFLNWLQLHMETGVGLENGDGAIPTITLQVSRDQGRTWSAPRTIEVGRLGEYQHLPTWRCLGRARGWPFRFTYEAPTPCTLLDLYADAVVGLSGY